MKTEPKREWVLPASIPFEGMKGRDLEECLYWLLDAMGAKDLEWRTGGTGGAGQTVVLAARGVLSFPPILIRLAPVDSTASRRAKFIGVSC